MQTITLSSNVTNNGRLPETKPASRLRAFRLLSERYAQRERPSVAPEFALLATIVLVSTWSMVSLANAMALR